MNIIIFTHNVNRFLNVTRRTVFCIHAFPKYKNLTESKFEIGMTNTMKLLTKLRYDTTNINSHLLLSKLVNTKALTVILCNKPPSCVPQMHTETNITYIAKRIRLYLIFWSCFIQCIALLVMLTICTTQS